MRSTLAPRAAVYLAIGFYITFMQGRGYNTFIHNGGIRWAMETLVWLAGGVIVANLAPLAAKKFRASYSGKLTFWLPEVLLAVGVIALVLANPFNTDELIYRYFVAIVASWGFANAASTAYQTLSAAKGSQDRKDGVTSTALSLALGLLFVSAPLGALPAVGFLAAYLAIMGVHLGISAATARKG